MIALACPSCGIRNLTEFRFGGGSRPRPAAAAGDEVWSDYIYFRENPAGLQTEWWYHGMGCGLWFLAVRDTRSNEVKGTRAWTPDGMKGDAFDGD